MNLKIEFIMCTHNRLNFIKKNLYLYFDIIKNYKECSLTIVDSASNDGSYEYLVNNWNSKIKIFKLTEPGLSRARNFAIKKANASHLVFIDDDSYPDKNFVSQLMHTINSFDPDIIGGSINIENNHSLPGWFNPNWERRVKQVEASFTNHLTFSGGNLIIKKNIFELIGYFNEDLGMVGSTINLGEEKEIMQRYFKLDKQQAYYNPNLKIFVDFKHKANIIYRLKREFSYFPRKKFKFLLPKYFRKVIFKVKKLYFKILDQENFKPLGLTNSIIYKMLILVRTFGICFKKVLDQN